MKKVCHNCKQEYSSRVHGDLCPECRKEYHKHYKVCKSCNTLKYFTSSRQHICDICKKELEEKIEHDKHYMLCPCCEHVEYFSISGVKQSDKTFVPSKFQQYCDKCFIDGNPARKEAQLINKITNTFVSAFYGLAGAGEIKNRYYLEYLMLPNKELDMSSINFYKLRETRVYNEKYFQFINILSSKLALAIYKYDIDDNTINTIIECFINAMFNKTGYCIPDLSQLNTKFTKLSFSKIFSGWYNTLGKLAKPVLDVIFFFKNISTEGSGEFLLKMFGINVCKPQISGGDIHYNNGMTAEVKLMISEVAAGRLLTNRDTYFSVRTEADKQYAIDIIKNTKFGKITNINFDKYKLQDFVFFKSNEKHITGLYKDLYDNCPKEYINELVLTIIRKLCYKNYTSEFLLNNIDLSNEENFNAFMLINVINIYLDEIKNDQLILAAPYEYIIINKNQLKNYTLADCKDLLKEIRLVFPTTELTLANKANDRNKNRGFAIMKNFQ